MLYSMTGFGRTCAETPDKKITVEIKSLNSKQMDLTSRIPAIFREKENEIRNIVTTTLQRGKADMIVSVEQKTGSTNPVLNIEVLKAYKQQVEEMAAQLGIPTPDDWYSVLLRFPDIQHTETPDSADAPEVEALAEATKEAVSALMQHRREEGIRLEEFFTVRIERISALLARIPEYEKERIALVRSRIEDGLAKLALPEYNQDRLEQEMIFYIEKLDINEEKQRLAQHLRYFMETMQNGEGGQGKKLGFISQEMGREINTLGSKSNHAEMQKIVVMMKDELEQIKEQVLNVM